jgi:hypothetical protein
MFSLYTDHPDFAEAAEAGNNVIKRFIADMQCWRAKYSAVGADDTAARETFAQDVAEKLGIMRISRNLKSNVTEQD